MFKDCRMPHHLQWRKNKNSGSSCSRSVLSFLILCHHVLQTAPRWWWRRKEGTDKNMWGGEKSKQKKDKRKTSRMVHDKNETECEWCLKYLCKCCSRFCDDLIFFLPLGKLTALYASCFWWKSVSVSPRPDLAYRAEKKALILHLDDWQELCASVGELQICLCRTVQR